MTTAVEAPAAPRALIWGIRSSFCSYVLGQPDGGCDLSGGAQYLMGGEFLFPVAEDAGSAPEGALRFTGSADFTAHGGAMRVVIAEPHLVRLGTEPGAEPGAEADRPWALTVADAAGGRLTLARLREEDGAPKGDSVVLSQQGAELFGGRYRAGDALDPLLMLR